MSEEIEFDEREFDDKDFAEIDALIEMMRKLPRPSTSMINPIRIEQMRFSAAMIKRTLRENGSEAKVNCRQSEFNPYIGGVEVEGAEIYITNMEDFARAAEFANNTEVYPLAKNKVRMTFTFHGLTIPLEYPESN